MTLLYQFLGRPSCGNADDGSPGGDLATCLSWAMAPPLRELLKSSGKSYIFWSTSLTSDITTSWGDLAAAMQVMARQAGGYYALVCQVCQEIHIEKETRLTKLWKQSRRQNCNCGAKMQHDDRCPMHPRSFGEKPFPACDKMSREESEWLRKRWADQKRGGRK